MQNLWQQGDARALGQAREQSQAGKELHGLHSGARDAGVALRKPSDETLEEEEIGMTEHKHVWTEEYYGWRCVPCGLFYPFGSAPWEAFDDDGIRDEWDDDDEAFFDCGWVRGMGCMKAGSEECDWECPDRRNYEKGMALTQARLAKRARGG